MRPDRILILGGPGTGKTTLARTVASAREQRCRGGHDWDLRSVVRVARGARSFHRRPLADPEQLRDRDEANGSRTLERFFRSSGDRVVRCRTTRQVRRATEWLTR